MTPLVVEGDSMRPAIAPGTRVMVDADPDARHPGMVLCFETAGGLVTHRLVGRFRHARRWVYVQAPEDGHRVGLVPEARVVGVCRALDGDHDWFRAPTDDERRLARRAEALYRLRRVPPLCWIPVPSAVRDRLLARR